MIKLQALGNLGRDAVLQTVNGKNIINFSTAYTKRYRDSLRNQKEHTI
jgi:single-strand DNA-binding protein